MIEFLKGWVLNIVGLAIFIVLLEILVPSGKTKKFINLVSGFVLIIAIITPFLNIARKGIDLKEFQIASSNFIDKREIENNSKILKEKQMRQITEVYRKKLIKQLEETTAEIEGVAGAKADVIINEDYNSDDFGEIKRVYLYLELSGDKQVIKPVSKIEKIEINGDDAVKSESKEVDSALKKKIESRINKILGVDEKNIVISLRE